MGNRAIICFESGSNGEEAVNGRIVEGYAIYLHYNGGPESVYAFLDVLNERMTGRGNDMNYAAARMVEIIGRFLGGNTSLGLLPINGEGRALIANRYNKASAVLSHGDNGIYVVGWNPMKVQYSITGRLDGINGSAERWFTPEEIAREERDARKDLYWHEINAQGEPKPTIVESVRHRAHMGMANRDAYRVYHYDDEAEAQKILAARVKTPPVPAKAKPKRSRKKVA